MVHLEEITPENWRVKLSVREDQQHFVADKVGILARAYAYRDHGSNAFFVYNEDVPVGIALYYDNEEDGYYNFSQFFIDQRYQQNGFGYAAATQILERMRREGKYDKVCLCYMEGDIAAKKLYQKLGFQLNGEAYENEIIMEMQL